MERQIRANGEVFGVQKSLYKYIDLNPWIRVPDVSASFKPSSMIKIVNKRKLVFFIL